MLLRMEDIDPVRSRPEYAASIRQDLAWLGLNWDAEVAAQSTRTADYERVLAGFEAQDLIYPCYCTRKELRELASAPQASSVAPEQGGVGDLGAVYPGTCRGLTAEQREALEAQGRRPCLRLRYPGRDLALDDLVMGHCAFKAEEAGGDFALRRSDGVFAYQLAVSVDDAEQGITQVVRGRDILASTPRQLYLLELLGAVAPKYAHVPLLLDHEGERLAKRHNSLRLAALREAGVSGKQVVGWLAWLAGLQDNFTPAAAEEFIGGFTFSQLPAENIFLTRENLPEFIHF